MARLIPVGKGADYLEVHPDALAEHKRLGWQECPARTAERADPTEPGTDDELDSLDVDQLRAIADERGIKVHHKAGADKIRAALREAQ